MTSIPFDLPTLHNHYSYFTINNKQIPILYRFVWFISPKKKWISRFWFSVRLKSDVYYPYIAFDLIIDELNSYCSSWQTKNKLPLLTMTLNERIFYKNLLPSKEFSSSSKLILCSIIDQFLQLIELLKQSKNEQNTSFACFKFDIAQGSVKQIDMFNSEATAK